MQLEIDRALTELQTKVLRQLVVNIETGDLIREYDRSPCFKDVYNYILCDKLTGNSAMQKKIAGEASNCRVANHLLFNIEHVKDDQDWTQKPLLAMPEKYEYNIFQRFYIPNLFVKLKTFIEVCYVCKRNKLINRKNKPQYGCIPKDYILLEHLAVDVKYMPEGFDGFKFLVVVACEQTNFVFAIPTKEPANS